MYLFLEKRGKFADDWSSLPDLPDLLELLVRGRGVVGLLKPPVHLDPLKLPSPLFPTTSISALSAFQPEWPEKSTLSLSSPDLAPASWTSLTVPMLL